MIQSTKMIIAAATLSMAGLVSSQGWACEPGKMAAPAGALAARTIKMGLDPETPPYATRDPQDMEKFTGSDIDLSKAVFACAGLKYEYMPGAWSGLLPAVNAGQVNLMYYLYYSAERAKQVDFIVYMKAGDGIMVQAGNPKKVHSEADLCGLRITVVLGTVEEAQMRTLTTKCEAEKKAAIEIMTAADSAAGMRLVSTGRADADIDDLVLVDTLIAQQPKTLELAYSVIGDTMIGIAVKKGEDQLVQALLAGLKAVQDSGEQAAIFKKYGMAADLIIPAKLYKE